MNVVSDIDRKRAVAIVEQLAEAKSRQAVDESLALYHPDAVLVCPPWGTEVQGHAQVRSALEAFFWLVPDYHVEVQGAAFDGGTLCAWGTISMRPVSSLRGDPVNGRRVTTPVFILLRFRDGGVIWESFNFDAVDVARQCGVPAEAFAPGIWA